LFLFLFFYSTMPLTRQEKEKIVKELSENISKANAVVFADFTGLNVAKTRELRKRLKQAKIGYKVVKKTLIGLALKAAGLKDVAIAHLKGPVSLAFGYDDEVAPAKIVHKFSKSNEALKIVGGILEKRLITPAEVASLASLPAKPELLAKTLSTMNAPISNFVGVLHGNLRKLVYVLSAIKK